jgi:hypothetical protein
MVVIWFGNAWITCTGKLPKVNSHLAGFVDGLWSGGKAVNTDFHAIAHEMKLLGFNAIRLPFTFSALEVGYGYRKAAMSACMCQRNHKLLCKLP